MLDDIPGGLEPFGRRTDVGGEGAIPSLDERDGRIFIPVGADAVGDRSPAFEAHRRQVAAGRPDAEE